MQNESRFILTIPIVTKRGEEREGRERKKGREA